MMSHTVRLEWPGSTKMVVGGTNFLSLARIYRVIHLVGENLPLTQFRQFWQLVGHYCSYQMPYCPGKMAGLSQQEVVTIQMVTM